LHGPRHCLAVIKSERVTALWRGISEQPRRFQSTHQHFLDFSDRGPVGGGVFQQLGDILPDGLSPPDWRNRKHRLACVGQAPWRKSAIQLYRNWRDVVAKRKAALLEEAPIAVRWGG
jgi:hypothetical protein